MASGTQAAALAKSKQGSATSLNKCVYGIVYEVLNPLGVPAPQTEYIPTFVASPLVKKIPSPVIGCVARWPRPAYEHVSIITDMSDDGSRVYEVSWGTSNGKVRGFWYDTSFFESFWLPSYDGSTSTVGPASYITTAGSTSATSAVTGIPDSVFQGPFWARVGVGVIGAVLILIAILKMTGADNTIKSGVKVAATLAAKVPVK